MSGTFLPITPEFHADTLMASQVEKFERATLVAFV